MSGEVCGLNKTSPVAKGQHSVAYVTTPNEEVAKNISRGLITNKLAACINLIPKITSIYMWKGEVTEDSEVLMMIKTKTSKIEELTEFVKKNHPYEVCEVISLPIQNGNSAYLKWIDEVMDN